MKLNTKFGQFGGVYLPEMMVKSMEELETAFITHSTSPLFQKELQTLLKDYAGRPTPLYFAENLSKFVGCKIYLKREDLLHTGAHKINNTLGQALLAKYMGKTEILAETGAGQHGVAVAVAGALLKIPVKVFMGAKDVERQSLNVYRMKLFGTKVIPVNSGSKTLKDAVNESMRYYLANVKQAYYLLGSVVGPHPYPNIVEHFQQIIGEEAKEQIKDLKEQPPTKIIACVGGGSNAIGIFKAFLEEKIELIGVEAAGNNKKHGKTLGAGKTGVFQGSKSYVLQTDDGQIEEAHSISAGLDYPGVGPMHSYLKDTNRVTYTSITDKEALEGFDFLCKKEGILPALESAHAVGFLLKHKNLFKPEDVVILCLSGRGDKDIDEVMKHAEK
ncbi:MAG: tryptophan synthase subunit beta [Candidatus Woesearchaeota archaeon]|jgi:tryptophan synthase beta chain|nr:tryptophan synthase subunit beta [Candidatus Woesearchaeota archaeon]MDP7458566.1 tryptophan synthase subunit beta [Candidatus Woesearchaeota archaeon]|tara:strand:+ start:945 stop:2105 length:1161 start_codon:yes stop_codon:yes gene_type:complete